MVRVRRLVLLVVIALVASLGLALAPGSATAGTTQTVRSMPAVNKGAPTAEPDARPDSAPVKVMAAKTKPTAPIALTVQAPNPTTYGDTVQLTAVVNLAQVAPGGTVRFIDGGVQIGSSSIDGSGIARMSTNTLRAAKHSLTATYTVGATTVTTLAVSLTVAKRNLHLYANPSRWSRPVGGANPAYTVAIPESNVGDLVNGDSLATAVSGKPTFSNAAGPTSPASIYPLTLSGLKSTNYNLVYLTAGYTVYTKDLVAGDTAPDFTAPDQNGTSFSLSSLRGRVVLLDFSAGWCGPSNSLAHDIPTIASELQAQGIPFSYLPVLVDGPTPGVAATQQTATNFFTKYNLPAGTHVLHVDGLPAALNQPLPGWDDSFYGYGAIPDDNVGNLAFPTLAMIDAGGVVRGVSPGYAGIDGVVSALSAIAPDTGVQVTSAPNQVTTSHDATIGFTTSGGVPATCSFDGGAFGPCTSPQTFSNVPDGDHTLEILAQGFQYSALVSWRVITLDTQITGGPGTGFIPAWTFTGNGVGFVCWTGNETPYPCQSGDGDIDIPGGVQTFHVAAVDAFGNQDDTPATDTYDFKPLPTITLVPDNPNPAPFDSVVWTVTVTDGGGNPVTGQVQFYRPGDNGTDPIDLDANGSASITEPGIGAGYDLYVIFLGSATAGAEDHLAHINVT